MALKSDYLACYLLLGYQEGAYKVVSLCTNADDRPLWTVTLVLGENTTHLVWWKACFHASFSSSLKLQILLYPLRCLSDGEKVTFLYINRQSQCKEKARNGMLKYELLKLTFQGVLRIMILRFYCAVFNLKSKWLFKLQVEIDFFREYITCVSCSTISILSDMLFCCGNYGQ